MKSSNKFLACVAAVLGLGCTGAMPDEFGDTSNDGYSHDSWKDPVVDAWHEEDTAQADAYQPPPEDTYVAPDTTPVADTYVAPDAGPKDGDACDDGNQCTDHDCWHGGQCVGTDESAACNKGVAGYKYWCDPETGCQSAPVQTTCDDNVECTLDIVESGVCKHKPTAAFCDDGDACTTNACKADVGCVVTATVVCEDGLACTDNECNPNTGLCNSVLNCADNEYCSPNNGTCTLSDDGVPDDGTGCDDGNACTFADRYTGGVCAGSAKSCNDSKSCTTDSCNAATGCANVIKSCGDGKACTVDSCDEAAGCVNEINCDDGKPTTTDSCNASGECVNTPVVSGPSVGDPCNDNDSCTENDKIVVGWDCVGTVKDCNDGKACTVDSCAAGVCKNIVSCASGQSCSASGQCYTPASTSPFKEVTIKWYPTFATYHVAFQGWYCQGGTLNGDKTTATGCKAWSNWDEFFHWDGNPNSSPLVKTFQVPKGSWLYFNPLYNLSQGGGLSDWCDSPTGYSTGIEFEVWVDGVKQNVDIVTNGYTGCNGLSWIPE